MIKHFNITVSGRVQGVGFRYSVRSIAQILKISGFVKNLYNGSVYIEAEGEDQPIHEFIEWCKKGPDRSRIDFTNVIPGEVENFQGFEVRF